MKLTILYDNDAWDESLHTGWGFSCLVEKGEERLLFDAAWDGEQVIDNARRLGVLLETVRKVFISHKHWDHLGGLARMLGEIAGATVYVPASFSERLKGEISARARLVEVDAARAVGDGIYSTGEAGVGELKEQALVIDVSGGVALLTGCAHPGLGALLDLAAARGEVVAAIGGFHGFGDLERLASLETIVPCHCTERKEAILERFPGSARRAGSGLELELE